MAGIGDAELVLCGAAVEDLFEFLVFQLVVVAIVVNGQEGAAQAMT